MDTVPYHELRKVSPRKAREVVREVFEKNGRNVSKTARILGISRATVRRAVYGSLEDESRRPKSSPRRTPFEELIVEEARKTGFGSRRLSKHLQKKYSLLISENTIRSVLKRNKLTKSREKRSRPTIS